MTTKANFARDINGFNTFSLPPADTGNKFSATLAAATEQTVTVPENFKNWLVIFSIDPGDKVYFAFDETAEVPAGGTFVSTTSELNPPAKTLAGGTVIHVITAGNTIDVGVTMYGIE